LTPALLAQPSTPLPGITKWSQLPDLETGWDVLSQYPYQPGVQFGKLLADDFLCTQTGPITGVRVWGSWWGDLVLNPAQPFQLTFWTDVKAGSDQNTLYSHPGAPLWTHVMTSVGIPVYPSQEGFWDPNLNESIGRDTVVWQYDFLIPASQAFYQTESEIYWLSVQRLNFEPNDPSIFGWKTAFEVWNDDAAWTDNLFDLNGNPVPIIPWQELIIPDPAGNRLSRDMAFQLATVPEPVTVSLLAGLGLLGFGLVRRFCR
ncbi:MAG: PEP-CTERM sorting domain-containing protein, partial [Verrucomicrobia bacterium]|nr:PEP-CTERM sorting domain-containing protein [Verrucomicrobiota bacterium]